jgi:hypothetical protein
VYRRVVAVITLVALGLLGGCAKSDPPAPVDDGVPSATLPAGWALPADMSAAAGQAGLPMLGQENLTVHYHAHLDIIVRGARIVVPAFVGIDLNRQRISPLHTHDTSGVVHIESATDLPYTLGQFFTEWGQPLTAAKVGPVTVGVGEEVRIYQGGAQVSGDPGALKLSKHAEIVVWIGTRTDHPDVPAKYAFAAGL